jgi:hypothetical protein
VTRADAERLWGAAFVADALAGRAEVLTAATAREIARAARACPDDAAFALWASAQPPARRRALVRLMLGVTSRNMMES